MPQYAMLDTSFATGAWNNRMQVYGALELDICDPRNNRGYACHMISTHAHAASKHLQLVQPALSEVGSIFSQMHAKLCTVTCTPQ